jgi:hypothetical protein
MFVKELDVPIVNSLRNGFPNLMRGPSFDHIQCRPAVFRLSSRARTHEQGIFQLALQVVLFDMICEHCRDFPVARELVSWTFGAAHGQSIDLLHN